MILCEKVITEFKYILSLKLKGCGKGRETAAGQGHLTACVAGENGFACIISGIRMMLDSELGFFGKFSVITKIQWGSVTPEQSLRAFGLLSAPRR